MLLRLSHALNRICTLLCDASGILLVMMAVLINIEVVSRYLLGRSTLLADEYSGYMFVWLTLLGFAEALRTGQFLRVEIVVRRAKGRAGRSLEALSALLGAIVSAILAWACLGLFLRNLDFGTVSIQPSATPLWMPQIILPAGFAWLCLIYVDILVRQLRGDPGAGR